MILEVFHYNNIFNNQNASKRLHGAAQEEIWGEAGRRVKAKKERGQKDQSHIEESKNPERDQSKNFQSRNVQRKSSNEKNNKSPRIEKCEKQSRGYRGRSHPHIFDGQIATKKLKGLDQHG